MGLGECCRGRALSDGDGDLVPDLQWPSRVRRRQVVGHGAAECERELRTLRSNHRQRAAAERKAGIQLEAHDARAGLADRARLYRAGALQAERAALGLGGGGLGGRQGAGAGAGARTFAGSVYAGEGVRASSEQRRVEDGIARGVALTSRSPLPGTRSPTLRARAAAGQGTDTGRAGARARGLSPDSPGPERSSATPYRPGAASALSPLTPLSSLSPLLESALAALSPVSPVSSLRGLSPGTPRAARPREAGGEAWERSGASASGERAREPRRERLVLGARSPSGPPLDYSTGPPENAAGELSDHMSELSELRERVAGLRKDWGVATAGGSERGGERAGQVPQEARARGDGREAMRCRVETLRDGLRAGRRDELAALDALRAADLSGFDSPAPASPAPLGVASPAAVPEARGSGREARASWAAHGDERGREVRTKPAACGTCCRPLILRRGSTPPLQFHGGVSESHAACRYPKRRGAIARAGRKADRPSWSRGESCRRRGKSDTLPGKSDTLPGKSDTVPGKSGGRREHSAEHCAVGERVGEKSG